MVTPPSRPRRLRSVLLAFLLSPVAALAQTTETPQPVEPGHFLLEVDALTLRRDRADTAGASFRGIGVLSTLASAGLTRDVDLQIGVDVFQRFTVGLGGVRTTDSGFGDLYFRSKWRFWQDAASGQSAAVIPYVKIPSNTGGVGNDSVEGGVIVPWEKTWSGGASLGAMAAWDVVRNPDDSGYDSWWTFSACAHHSLTSRLGLYAESILTVTSASSSLTALSVGGGAVFSVTKSISLDYELQRGIGRAATDWTHTFRVNWGW
jgi:hypothetical protein